MSFREQAKKEKKFVESFKKMWGWKKPQTLQEKYGFEKDRPLSMAEAQHIARKEKEKTDSERRAEAAEIEYYPEQMSFEDREKFLLYALSLCKGRANYVAILRVKIGMARNPVFGMMNDAQRNIEVAKGLKEFGVHVTHADVEKLERDALEFVKDRIQSVKTTHLPLLGGLN